MSMGGRSRYGKRRGGRNHTTKGGLGGSTIPGSPLVWYDGRDPAVLFQDTARTSLITSAGQEVQGVTDKGSAQLHLVDGTTNGGPTWETDGIIPGASAFRFVLANKDNLHTTDTTTVTGNRIALTVFSFEDSGAPTIYLNAMHPTTNDWAARLSTADILQTLSDSLVIDTVDTLTDGTVFALISESRTNDTQWSRINSNGTPVTDTITHTDLENQGFVLGSQSTAGTVNCWEGDISEYAAWHGVIPTRASIQRYATARYGIVWT